MIAACISSMGVHLLHQTFSQVNHVAVTVRRVSKIMCVLCREKSYRTNLHRFIQNNHENNMLFGPKLKIKIKKTTQKKNSKTKQKKDVLKIKTLVSSETVVHEDGAFLQIKDEIICDQSSWDPYICDENIEDSFISCEEFDVPSTSSSHGSTVTSKRTTGSRVSSKSVNSTKPTKPRITYKESEETLPDVPDIDGLLKASLYPDNLSFENELQTFKTHIDKFSLRRLPSVTAILNKTQSELSRFYLEKWKEEMTEKLGEEGFKSYQEEMLRNGINLHANVQQFLSGEKDIQVQPKVEGYWQSLDGVLSKLGDVSACEDSVSHTELKYTGKFDCVAVYRDCLCVIDWKTSQKPKPLLTNTFDSPIQVAAYVGAINSSAQIKYGPITSAAIVIAYPWGEPAHVHLMRQKVCEKYWQKWLQRLHQYWKMLSAERNIL